MNEIQYRTIKEALHELNAQDKGRYFLCTCPECQKDEAFIYKNNMRMIQCNRKNECGERIQLRFVEKNRLNEFIETNPYTALTYEQNKELHQLTKFLKYMQKYPMSPTLDSGYRGLSRETLRPFIADLRDTDTVKKMFKNARSIFMKDYDKNNWMCKRNLVFPIYGEDGLVERILLRSSIEPNIEPKEIQLSVNPSKDTRDFFVDIPKRAGTIVITEAIMDGASFREIDSSIGLISLTGASKTRKVTQFLSHNHKVIQNKKVILALDNDEAGKKSTDEIIKTLVKIEAKYDVFPFPDNNKDANEFLNINKVKFQQMWREIKGKNRQMNKQKDFIFEK